MFPGTWAQQHSRQAGPGDRRDGADHHLRRARRTQPPAGARASPTRGCGPVTWWRWSATTPPRPTRSTGRRCAPGSTSPRSTTTSPRRRRPTSSTTAAPRRWSSPRPRPTSSRRWPTWSTCRCGWRSAATVPGCTSYDDALAAASTEPLADQPHGDDFLYSSGTTGRPKGIKLPLLPIKVDEPGYPYVMIFGALFGYGAGHRLPLAGAGLPRGPAALHGRDPGARRHGRADAALRAGGVPRRRCRSTRVTDTQVVPTMFVRMLKLPEEVRASYDTSSLKTVVHAAAPCPVEVKQQMMEWLGPDRARVLRQHRGQRRDVRRTRGLAGAPGHGRPVAARHPADLRPGGQGAAGRRGRDDLLRARRRAVHLPRRRRTRPRPRGTPSTRSGRRSATSATSTTRATSSSPTARRS